MATDRTDRTERSAAGDTWVSSGSASGWQSGAAARVQAFGPATELMLDLAGVAAGARVLDLGAGTGDQTIMAAQRVGSGGLVLATDISAAMLDVARESARAAGLSNIRIQVMDAQRIDLEPGSFDAVIARLSLQFVPDVPRALAEARRVLRAGGRLAAIVYSAVERNSYRAGPQAIASRLAGRPFPEAGPGQWALNDPTPLAGAFRQAGFRDVDVRAVALTWRFPSLEDALRNLEEAVPVYARLVAELSEADRATARAEAVRTLRPFVGSDGFEAPGELLIAVGTG
jgi:ubiquinone/menaquinone biosynthesis C-methylase UbiE